MLRPELRSTFRPTGAARTWLLWGLALVAAVLLVLTTRWCGERQQRQEIAALPAQDRQVLFQHTLVGFRALCVDRPLDRNLTAYCERQQDFLQAFPECTRDCQALLERFARPSATR